MGYIQRKRRARRDQGEESVLRLLCYAMLCYAEYAMALEISYVQEYYLQSSILR